MSDNPEHKPRIIDRAFATLRTKRIIDSEGKIIKIYEPTAMALRLALRKATVFLYSDQMMRAAEQLWDTGFDFINQLLPRLRLPADVVWIEPLSVSSGELPDDISNIGFLIERAPRFGETAFSITGVHIDNEDTMVNWSLLGSVFNPLEEIFGTGGQHNIWHQASKFFNADAMDVLKNKPEYDQHATAKFTMHSDVIASPYPILRSFGPQQIVKLSEFEQIVKDTVEDIHQVVCLLLLLNLGGKLSPEISDGQTPRSPGLPHNFREFLSHRTVTISLSADRIDREFTKLMGSGIRHKRHGVIEHWCVSRRKGKPECKYVRRVCKPRVIDARINACEFCEKTEWRRDAHERGDASLGYITHDYVVTE